MEAAKGTKVSHIPTVSETHGEWGEPLIFIQKLLVPTL